MFGKTSSLKALEARKQLLLAESEVNRIELLKDFHALKDGFKIEVERVKKQALVAGSIASTAALIATGISLFRRHPNTTESDGLSSKVPWIAAALEGARTGASLFGKLKSLFRNRSHE